MNAEAVDSVIRYALAIAAENDDWLGRQLGPIHLVKYVYLADLAYAESHGGDTYTAAHWRFHHFGPWAVEVFERVEPGAIAFGAQIERISSSQFENDFVRYRLDPRDAADRLSEIERTLPAEVRSRVNRAVHEFGNDTQSLLSFVYRTRPMLRAAPGANLDFYVVVAEVGPQPGRVAEPEAQYSKKAEKRRRAALEELRSRIQQRLRERLGRVTVAANPAPRYDEVFAEGQRQLEELAGEALAEGEIEGRFSDDIWHSRGRAETELP